MWCWRRIEKIKCLKKVTNAVVEHIGDNKRLLNSILRRKSVDLLIF
jgi:hypothetical protein